MKISVKHELAKLRKDLTAVRRTVIPKATARAINTTARQAQGTTVKEIAKRTGLKQKDVRAGMTRSRATPAVARAEIVARGRPLNLIRFRAGQRKKGVSAAPWKKRRVFKGAWIGNDGRTVFKRAGKARYPIRGVYGPGIAQSMNDKAVLAAALETFRARWPINFAADLKFYLAKQGGKVGPK